MAHNKLDDLRDHLFEQIEILKDTKTKVDLERISAIRDIAQVIVNSAKVEVDFLKVTASNPTTQLFKETPVNQLKIENKRIA